MTLQLRPTFSESWYRVAPLKPKLRAGAQISRQFYRGERWYVVRDPAGNQYHRLSDAAYKFVGLLDGNRSIAEAWELVGGQLADDAPTQPEVIQILSQLYSANLIETNISPDATVLLRRHKKMMMHKAKGRLMNVLFPRIPLWDLDWFLKYFMPILRPILSVAGIFIWLAVVLTAGVLCAPHWDMLLKQGQESIAIWQNPLNAFWLYLAFAFIKFIHELGHGFMCRRFGGEVHELGIMFLVLFPAPYVDASSAWSFTSRWHRVLVGAGGMIFELFVAGVCAFFWLGIKDSGSYLSLFLYNVMLIASVTTVLFNANPLLRYDGYYILSDLLEIPNLQSKSREYTLSLFKRYLFGVKWSQPLPHGIWTKLWMVVYFCLSGPYRVTVGLAIMIMVLFQLPEQLKFLGMVMGLGSLATFFIVPAYKSFTYLTLDPELHRKRAAAWAWSGAFATAALVVLAFIRFPLNVRAEAIMQPRDRAPIYAQAPGFLEQVLKTDGQSVRTGEPILVLKNDELATNLVKAQAAVTGYEVELRAAESDTPARAATAQQRLTVAQGEVRRLEDMIGKLTIRAGKDGRIVAPRIETRLGSWIGITTPDQPLGEVARAERLVGYAMIDQGDVELLSDAQHRALGGKTEHPNGYQTMVRFVGDLTQELRPTNADTVLKPAGSRHVRSVAMTAAGGGQEQVDPRDPQGQQLMNDQFEFEVNVNNASGYFQPNQRAYVRIRMDQGESLVWQGWRRLNQLIQTTKSS